MAERRSGGCLGRIIGILVILGILGVLFIYSGLYNVAANYPDRAAVAWVFGTTLDHSVHRHAAGIEAPGLDDPAMIRAGLKDYREACVGCHGAPGVHMEQIVKGFNPEPPELTEAAADWQPNELFWITKNGVRMSGMPAWEVTLSDQKIWTIVAFARELPTMTPDEYKAMVAKLPSVKKP